MIYDFSAKRHWRRTVWNTFRDELGADRRDALVVYLAGAEDEDRQIAIEKGFRADNLVAVERDRAVAARLRRQGALTLHGDVFEHLRKFHPARAISVVHLDLCGGLTQRTVMNIISAAYSPAAANAMFCVNLLRGREVDGDWMRSGINEAYAADGAGATKHRGEMLWAMLVHMIPGIVYGDSVRAIGAGTLPHNVSLMPEHVDIVLGSKIAQLSYRSTANQTFDSVIFRSPFGRIIPPHAMARARETGAGLFANTKERRQQAAVMAHRTRRHGVPA